MEVIRNRAKRNGAPIRVPRKGTGTVTRELEVRTESADICRGVLV